MNKLVFVTRKIPDIGINMLRDAGYEVDINTGEEVPTTEEIVERLRQKPYDAVLTLLTDRVTSEVFDAAPQAKIFANYAIGFDNIDVEEAARRGVAVTNTPGDYAVSVAEHAIAMMLALSVRLVESDSFVRKGLYKGWSPSHFVGTDLHGTTLGLIGAGRIGEKLAHIAYHGFGMPILYYDVRRNEQLESSCEAKYYNNVEDILMASDFVSLHVPLMDSTKHLINKERLAMMKPTSFLINTSRGPVVDEVALYEALKSGVIKGAGLDVYEHEPLITDGLTELSNVVLTPHTASAREKARAEMAEIAARNIISFLETGVALNPVK